MQKRKAVNLSLFVVVLLLSFVALPSSAETTGVVLASFSTSIQDQPDSVKQNVTIAAEKLDGVLVKSGSVFSFNRTVGEASVENGFVEGLVLYQDKAVLEEGGGLCQVSSTLYNAFLIAGFVIIERYRHFQPVSYVPLGLDATIRYGKKNLRMKNNQGIDVVIKTSVTDSTLNIQLIAQTRPQHRYEIFTEEEELEIPFKEDSENIRPGLTVYVYRKKIVSGKLVETGLLYKDFYPPVKYD